MDPVARNTKGSHIRMSAFPRVCGANSQGTRRVPKLARNPKGSRSARLSEAFPTSLRSKLARNPKGFSFRTVVGSVSHEFVEQTRKEPEGFPNSQATRLVLFRGHCHEFAEQTRKEPEGFPWPGAESNCRPQVFQTCALPTELPGQSIPGRMSDSGFDKRPDPGQLALVPGADRSAGTTGFEPATSGLTGRRELLASPRPRTCPQGNSNPRYRLERAASWAARRWGRARLSILVVAGQISAGGSTGLADSDFGFITLQETP